MDRTRRSRACSFQRRVRPQTGRSPDIPSERPPDGYTAENITQALNVTVRAPQEVLDQISEVNLRAVADLSNLGTNASGVFTPTVEIKIDGFPEAGCVGEYKIYITLKEKH